MEIVTVQMSSISFMKLQQTISVPYVMRILTGIYTSQLANGLMDMVFVFQPIWTT